MTAQTGYQLLFMLPPLKRHHRASFFDVFQAECSSVPQLAFSITDSFGLKTSPELPPYYLRLS